MKGHIVLKNHLIATYFVSYEWTMNYLLVNMPSIVSYVK